MGQLNAITNFITQLLTQHIGQFAFLGQGMFLSFATIMIVWFGVKNALGSSDRSGGFHFANFAALIMMIAFGFAMTQYYAAPIPGIGRSFYHLIIDQTSYLSDLLTGTQLQNASDAINQYQGQIQSPGLSDFSGSIAYIIDIAILAVWKAVAIIITAYGFVAQAICILIGPVFTVLHRSQAGMAFLGVAQMLHAVCLLPGHRRRDHVRHGEPGCLRSDPASVSARP
jgi:hypothetical protein